MSLALAFKILAFNAIGERMRAITGSKASLDDFASPAGDVGLFGPESMAWRVHAHFTAMMVGGLSSLQHHGIGSIDNIVDGPHSRHFQATHHVAW